MSVLRQNDTLYGFTINAIETVSEIDGTAYVHTVRLTDGDSMMCR